MYKSPPIKARPVPLEQQILNAEQKIGKLNWFLRNLRRVQGLLPGHPQMVRTMRELAIAKVELGNLQLKKIDREHGKQQIN